MRPWKILQSKTSKKTERSETSKMLIWIKAQLQWMAWAKVMPRLTSPRWPAIISRLTLKMSMRFHQVPLCYKLHGSTGLEDHHVCLEDHM